MRPLSWQVRTMLLIGTVGPPVASLILMTNTYLPLCVTQGESFDEPCFVAAFVLFAIPLGYVFGLVPALLAGVMYCAAVNGMAPLRPGVLPRACLAAVSGELVAEVWFRAVVGPDSHRYASVAALVMALLPLPSPRTNAVRLSCGNAAPLVSAPAAVTKGH
jgi:hypothetical protein